MVYGDVLLNPWKWSCSTSKDPDRFICRLVFIVSQSDGDIGIFAGDSLQITDYSGDFRESRLNEAKDIVLIAAGTGVLLVIIIILEASIPISQAVCQWVSQWASESVSGKWVCQ